MSPSLQTCPVDELQASSTELRQSPRFPLQQPIVAIPVGATGEVLEGRRLEGTAIDISSTGIAFEVSSDSLVDAAGIVIGVLADENKFHYAGMTISYCQPRNQNSKFRVGGPFGGIGHKLLASENRMPSFDSKDFMFRIPQLDAALESWIKAGIVKPRLLDKVTVCPQCQSVPTFRNACEGCKSARVENDKLIHHFACGHVGHVAEFEADGELTCPKCLTKSLIVGSDYEFLIGPYRCQDCGWCNSELLNVGHCLRCNYRFDICQAHELELHSYDVIRMDPLALVASVY